ncbi:MAG: trypsin-like peptidase domain-containing protein [Clostridia bacterium]|nr:trypsin-like peptidase domain-containing protein [Clostridia bacterium]
MSNTWDKDPKEMSDISDESVTPNEPEMEKKAENTADQPVVPVAPSPQSPLVNETAPDGSYRYVPPRNVVVPPVYPAQAYRPVAQQPAPQPLVQPVSSVDQSKNGKNRDWIVVVAILAALAVLISGMIFAFWWIDKVSGTNPSNGATDGTGTSTTATKLAGSESAPSQLEQNPPPVTDDPDTADDVYCDNGYTTEYIANKNYNSTVVLTMYMDVSSYPYYGGETGMQEVGSASGIVWTANGYIITNCHCVIDDSTGKKFDRIDVTLYDGTVYENAQVIGADESTDLAVIKVEATDLTPAEFGDSDQLAIGSRVVAMGNAMGLSWTVTQGIVSAKARDVYEDNGYAIKCLQVDAAINSGNSGGPLLNKYGQVVGINSAKIVADGVEGLGFSIPINEAKVVLESLAQYGYVKGRVALGITGDSVNYGFLNGFMIVEITQDSCLKDTEAAVGDIIVGLDDVEVTDYGTLRAELAKHKVGDKVKLKLLRLSRTYEITTLEVEVTLKEQTANEW